MAADVVFTAEDPWYTNSASWHTILEFASAGPEAAGREELKGHMTAPLGLDFTSMPDGESAQVARWLSGVIERMLAAEVWDSERSRAHMWELARKLHAEAEIREPGGAARSSG